MQNYNWIDIINNPFPDPNTKMLVTLEPQPKYSQIYSALVKTATINQEREAIIEGANPHQQQFYSERFYVSAYMLYPSPYNDKQ